MKKQRPLTTSEKIAFISIALMVCLLIGAGVIYWVFAEFLPGLAH